ncbi:MAG: hypothetical protein ACR2F1_08005 [Nitrososphaeraceae archaeon]
MSETEIQQFQNERLNDKELEQLRRKYDRLALDICKYFDEDIERDRTRKSKIIEWANTLELLMIKMGQNDNIHLICSYLTNHVRKEGFSDAAERYIYECLNEFPQYKLNYNQYKNKKKELEESYCRGLSKLSGLPEECSIRNVKLQEAFETIKKELNYDNMDIQQAALFTEKLIELQEAKLKEADEKKIPVYKSKTLNEFDENKKNNSQFEDRISVPRPNANDEILAAQNPISQKLFKIGDLFYKWGNTEVTKWPVYFQEAREEICKNLDAFYDFFVPTVDNKYRYGPDDWVEIAYGWDDISQFAIDRLYPKPTIFCKKCKEHDYVLDPDEIKGITIPVMMHPTWNYDRKDPEHKDELFYWKCPSCNGTDRIVVEITRERVQDNLGIAREKFYDIVNRFPLAVANLVYLHEWKQPYSLSETHRMSPKLEASK